MNIKTFKKVMFYLDWMMVFISIVMIFPALMFYGEVWARMLTGFAWISLIFVFLMTTIMITLDIRLE